jgi:Fe2+ transport system protein FeoA
MAEAMGLRKGEKIRLSQVCGRNLVLTMSGVKIIIDKDIAKDIEVI